MKTFFAFIKLAIAVVVVGTFILLSLAVVLVVKDIKKRKKINLKLASISSRICLYGLNARVVFKNQPPAHQKNQNTLFVTNHLGFVDILVLMGFYPSLFITSFELKETPGLGLITEMGGCLYVERRNRSNIMNEVQKIKQSLEEGFNVVLFPEAMATDGEKVYPFKKTLLTATAGIGVPIQPAVINYTSVNGEKMSDRWRDHLFWYGDMSFHSNLWSMLQLDHFEVQIEFFDPVYCLDTEQRHEVATHLHTTISSKYIQIPRPTSGL